MANDRQINFTTATWNISQDQSCSLTSLMRTAPSTNRIDYSLRMSLGCLMYYQIDAKWWKNRGTTSPTLMTWKQNEVLVHCACMFTRISTISRQSGKLFMQKIAFLTADSRFSKTPKLSFTSWFTLAFDFLREVFSKTFTLIVRYRPVYFTKI